MTWRKFLLPKPATLIARAAVLIGILSILGLFADHWWLLDLFNHFQRQYFFTLLLLTLILLGLKSYRLAALAAVMMILPLARVAPTWWNPGSDPGGKSIRASTFNVLSANKRHEDTLDWIRKTQPDIIFLPEVDPIWAVALKPLTASHPHVVEHVVEGNFGFALYSKFPIAEHRIEPCGQMELPLLIAKITTPQGDLTLFGAHPVPPVTSFWSSERNTFLKEIVRHSKSVSGAMILLGDLNATRWSNGINPLFESGWNDTSNGHGAPATWMNANPLVSIPIDHILLRPSKNHAIYCRNRWVGPELGSDHRAVVADIVLQPQESQ